MRRPSKSSRVLLSSTAVDLLLAETLAFLLEAGVKPKRLSTKLLTKARSIAAGIPITAEPASSHRYFVQIGGVAHDWSRLPQYTDADGEPRPLKMKVLRQIVARRFPKDGIDPAIQWMKKREIIKTGPGGHVELNGGRQIVLGLADELALERAAHLAGQMLKVALRNARLRPKERDFDREAKVFYLPAKYATLWRDVILERATAFLEGLDNWLEDRNDPTFPAETIETSAHVVVSTSEPRKVLPSVPQRGKRH